MRVLFKLKNVSYLNIFKDTMHEISKISMIHLSFSLTLDIYKTVLAGVNAVICTIVRCTYIRL